MASFVYASSATGVSVYTDAVTTYLALALGKMADYGSSICTWHSSKEIIRNTYAQARDRDDLGLC